MLNTQPKRFADIGMRLGNRRLADRQKLVLRVGLLEQDGKSIFCLVRNISASGVQVKPYGRLSKGGLVLLRIGDKKSVPGTVIWCQGALAGVEFKQPLNPQALLRIGQGVAEQRRRSAPRVTTDLEASLRTGGRRHPAIVCDLSMTGARLRTVLPVTFGESTGIELPGLPILIAYVRWSHGSEYGVTFQAPLPMQIIADLLCGADFGSRNGSEANIQTQGT